MNFIFTDEQLELRAIVREFLADKSPEAAVRRLMATPSGYDPAVWKQMSDQLGLQGMAVPEEYEGSGFGYIELGIVFEEMGRAAVRALPVMADRPPAGARLMSGMLAGVGRAVAALVSDDTRYLTGAILLLDGGRTIIV